MGRVCGADFTVITLLHQVGISNYFTRKMHGQITHTFPLKGHVVIIQHATIYCAESLKVKHKHKRVQVNIKYGVYTDVRYKA